MKKYLKIILLCAVLIPSVGQFDLFGMSETSGTSVMNRYLYLCCKKKYCAENDPKSQQPYQEDHTENDPQNCRKENDSQIHTILQTINLFSNLKVLCNSDINKKYKVNYALYVAKQCTDKICNTLSSEPTQEELCKWWATFNKHASLNYFKDLCGVDIDLFGGICKDDNTNNKVTWLDCNSKLQQELQTRIFWADIIRLDREYEEEDKRIKSEIKRNMILIPIKSQFQTWSDINRSILYYLFDNTKDIKYENIALIMNEYLNDIHNTPDTNSQLNHQAINNVIQYHLGELKQYKYLDQEIQNKLDNIIKKVQVRKAGEVCDSFTHKEALNHHVSKPPVKKDRQRVQGNAGYNNQQVGQGDIVFYRMPEGRYYYEYEDNPLFISS